MTFASLSIDSMKTIAKRTTAVALAACVLVSIQGCTDEEALNTIGAIAIVGGAVAVGVAAGHDDGRDYGRDNGRGGWNGGHDGHDGRGGGRGGRYGYAAMIPATAFSQADATAQMAAHYQISKSAAAILKNSLSASVQEKSLQPIFNLGLSASDLQDIGANRMISNVGINNVSAKLDISATQARAVVRKMLADAQASKK